MTKTPEEEVGITCYANTAAGFSSILKQRYADFQVNEIDLKGNTVHLTDRGALREDGPKRHKPDARDRGSKPSPGPRGPRTPVKHAGEEQPEVVNGILVKAVQRLSEVAGRCGGDSSSRPSASAPGEAGSVPNGMTLGCSPGVAKTGSLPGEKATSEGGAALPGGAPSNGVTGSHGAHGGAQLPNEVGAAIGSGAPSTGTSHDVKPGLNGNLPPTRGPDGANVGPLDEELEEAMRGFEPLLSDFETLAGADNRAHLVPLIRAVVQYKREMAADKDPKFVAPILLEPTSDKELRTAMHAFFRREELEGFQTSTVVPANGPVHDQPAGQDLPIQVTFRYKAPKGEKGGRKRKEREGGSGNGWAPFQPWPGGSAEFCRFVMYKENMDSHAALSVIERLLNARKPMLKIAGTKDKRAVTSQHVTVFKVPPERLATLNRGLRGIWLGNFEFVDSQLWLGALSGNHFRLIMREVTGASPAGVAAAVEALKRSGFINYYGLQRFGQGSLSTQKVGACLLKGEWEEAVRCLLGSRPESSELPENADVREARRLFTANGDVQGALRRMPKYMVAERAVLEGLQKHGKTAHCRALSGIPRHMRQLFTHGYQSFLWNLAASHRAAAYGLDRPVAGDLVLIPNIADTSMDASEGGGEATDPEAGSEKGSIHVVTPEEAEAGTFAITDVVLPQPGNKIAYPEHATREIYHEAAAKDGVSLTEAPHNVRDFSLNHLPGAYRRVLQRPMGLTWRLLSYSDPNEDLAATDLDLAAGKPGPPVCVLEPGMEVEVGKRLALELEFSLPSSTYATMLIRELTKTSTSKEHAKGLTAAVEQQSQGL